MICINKKKFASLHTFMMYAVLHASIGHSESAAKFDAELFPINKLLSPSSDQNPEQLAYQLAQMHEASKAQFKKIDQLTTINQTLQSESVTLRKQLIKEKESKALALSALKLRLVNLSMRVDELTRTTQGIRSSLIGVKVETTPIILNTGNKALVPNVTLRTTDQLEPFKIMHSSLLNLMSSRGIWIKSNLEFVISFGVLVSLIAGVLYLGRRRKLTDDVIINEQQHHRFDEFLAELDYEKPASSSKSAEDEAMISKNSKAQDPAVETLLRKVKNENGPDKSEMAMTIGIDKKL